MRENRMRTAQITARSFLGPQAGTVPPHGGVLAARLASSAQLESLWREASQLPRVPLDRWALADLELFAGGALSPLEGFMSQADYEGVVEELRLVNGIVWPLPVTLAVPDEHPQSLRGAERAALESDGQVRAIIEICQIWRRDTEREAQNVYGTTDLRHPGVKRLHEQGDWLVGGRVTVLSLPADLPFASYRLTPAETRRIFAERGWKTVAGFQTRNPVHRAHEYLQKVALEHVDGLFLHPIGGETKDDDISLEVRMLCYKALLENYYPTERVLLALNPASMRYAGPREAVFHALVRKNFGCTHFIVGRDHAGVGNYYHPYAAHRVFEQFDREEIGIEPLFFENAFYCRRCAGMATPKTCPHTEDGRVILSGTAVRSLLARGAELPREFTRPEVAAVLGEATLAHPTPAPNPTPEAAKEAPIPFHRAAFDEAEVTAVSKVVRSGWLTMGPETFEFERRFREYVGARHAIAVASGTAALHLALAAVGLQAGDEVFVPTNTFTATAEVVTYFGARPVLVDIDPVTMNLDPGDAAGRVTPRTRAIIPVHFAGQPCELEAIAGLAERHHLCVIEDAAHALPATYRGKRIGTISVLTAFSFYATKTLATGEGGMVTTDEDAFAERIRLLRLHGISRDAWKRYSNEGTWYYEVEAAGYKYNLTDLQAALGLVQLSKCDALWAARCRIAHRYTQAFSGVPGLEAPRIREDRTSAWHLYVLRLESERLSIGRDCFIQALRKRGIGASVHFIPLHLHPFYRSTYGYKPGDFPRAEREFQRCLSLPIYPGMTDRDVDRVIAAVTEIAYEHRT